MGTINEQEKKSWGTQSRDAIGSAFKRENLGSSLGAIGGAVTSIAEAGINNAKIMDTSGIQSSINDTANTQFDYNDYDSLMSAYDPFSINKSNYTRKDVRGQSTGQLLTSTLGAGLSGASAGASVGGPWGAVIGGAVGLLGGGAGWITGGVKAKREAERLNKEAEIANNTYLASYSNNASNISQSMFNSAALNIASEGGQLDTYDQSKVNVRNFKMKHKKSRYKGFGNYYAYGGQMMSGDWSNGVVTINEGDTHERNPLGGVLMGVDQQGIPNLVEEGEVIFNDYVYSNRLKPTTEQLEEMHLDPKLEGLTYAEAAKKIQEESEIRPLDSISKNTLVDGLAKLTVMQEETRMKKERAKMLRMLRHMAIQEPQGPQEMQEEVPMEGGLPMENQGVQMPEAQFAEHTPRAYKQIQEEMPEQYADGGGLARYFDGGSWIPQIGPISNFKYFDATNNNYFPDYISWLNNYDITKDAESWNTLSDIYKKHRLKPLTLDIARTLGQDRKYGPFHNAMATAYDRFKDTQSTPQQTVVNTPQPTVTPQGTTSYILRGVDSNGMGIETPIFTDGYNEGSADWGKYKFSNTVTKDGNTTHYFSSIPPETPSPELGDYPKTNILQYAPALGSAISTFASLFQKPDYTNADLVARSRRGVRNVVSRPIGNYLQFNPYDVNYQQNKLINNNLGTQRNVLNTAGGNRGTALASLLAYDASASEKSGDLYRQALEYNDQQRKMVGEFNANTNRFNSQQGLQADTANQNMDLRLLDNVFQEASMRDAEFAGLQSARSANLTNLFNNMGEIGKDIYAAAQEKYLIDRRYVPGIGNITAKGGSIRRRKRRRC